MKVVFKCQRGVVEEAKERLAALNIPEIMFCWGQSLKHRLTCNNGSYRDLQITGCWISSHSHHVWVKRCKATFQTAGSSVPDSLVGASLRWLEECSWSAWSVGFYRICCWHLAARNAGHFHSFSHWVCLMAAYRNKHTFSLFIYANSEIQSCDYYPQSIIITVFLFGLLVGCWNLLFHL